MNVPTVGQIRTVIIGATGMVGGYALRYALEHLAVSRVTAIGRRKLGISHPKLDEVVHRDFADCSALKDTLSGQDAAVFCLGAYTGAVQDAELRKITVDYTIQFARVLHGSSPDAAFSFLSGKWRGPDRPKPASFCTLQGRGREGTARGGVPPRMYLPARIHLPSRAAKRTEFQLPLVAQHLSSLPRVVSKPGDQGRRFGPVHGGRRRQANRRARRPRFREP